MFWVGPGDEATGNSVMLVWLQLWLSRIATKSQNLQKFSTLKVSGYTVFNAQKIAMNINIWGVQISKDSK